MDLDPLLLSRIQFAFTISFHIIFPSFTIGLAAWLATMEAVNLATRNALYRRVFDFWLKVFAVSFGMGVVSGIVMAFQFGTNWSVLAEKTGSIQGPLLGYETFTAFLLEATFLGVVLFGRERVPRGFYFAACCMLTLGTMASSFWILANNSWMQVPVGHTIVDGKIIPTDWKAIIGGPVFLIRWCHMLLAAFLDHRHVRDRCRRLLFAAWHPPHRGAGDDALGHRARSSSDRGAVFLWAPERQVRVRASADQIRRYRGALAASATRHGGVVRDPG